MWKKRTVTAIILVALLMTAELHSMLIAQKAESVQGIGNGEQLAASDASSAIVANFYHYLLLGKNSSINDEQQIFIQNSIVRTSLVLGPNRHPGDVDPMHRTAEDAALAKNEQAKVGAAGPVVLDWFRAHREWFLPTNMKSANDIQISSLVRFVRTPTHMKGQGDMNTGWVVALFARNGDGSAKDNSTRAVVFGIKDGKIDPDDIAFDGFNSKWGSLSELEKWNDGKK
jgi:hypothetical protein